MMRHPGILVVVVGLPFSSASAQEVDARAALLASMEAMGADELETIEYSGAGFSSRIGQQYSVNGGWPTFQVVDYTRSIDFDAGWSREDYTRQQGDYPTFGRTPLAPVRVTAVVNGAHAWDMRGDEPVPLLRPYLDGIMFPMQIHTHQADPRLNPAHNYFQYDIASVKMNAPVEAMPVPDAIRTAARPPARVESEQLADGVWRLAGGSHHSLLVEFRDYVAVVEAPQNEERSLAVIAEVGRLVPDKPIQYVVNTHHHFDHAGGLRTYLSQGTTIVTHESNKQYYLDILFHPAPRTLQPDRMSRYNPMYWISRRPAPIETVDGDVRRTGKYVVTDGEQILEIIRIQDMAYELGDNSLRQGIHSEDMLIAYLPKERILINADLYSPPAPDRPAPAVPTPGMRTLYENIRKLRLDVERHAPIHGRVGTHDEFVELVTRR